MKLEMELSWEEWNMAQGCLQRRYDELNRKIREGDRKGRSIRWYREEAIILARVIEEFRRSNKESRNR
ncbi:hypothetical protein GCM10011571_07370 [Marinithermofilum abyssi]|uniref:Uncharacterized protein n=1 Tax=Marinithermofilum abyssi TaxID=1571185 RepID=A0A8J2YDB7_9BACL|nr:hypothetical protein [Marinithermofilum abyssi]GGE08586.1 hypothetical protein GCM10011571_07370 [Marinithermofilum abyssi]